MEMVHCIPFIVTAARVTPSHLMSCRVFSAFFTSFHLISCFPSFSQLFSACTNNSQYDFVLQSLHKALPSTTLHYKTCKKVLPSTTLHCFTRLAQNTVQGQSGSDFARILDAECIQPGPPRAFSHLGTQSCINIWDPQWNAASSLLECIRFRTWTESILFSLLPPFIFMVHSVFLPGFWGCWLLGISRPWPSWFRRLRSDCGMICGMTYVTHKKLDFTQISFYTKKLLHRASFYREAFYTEKLLLTEQAFVQRSFYTHTHRSFYAQKLSRSMAPEFVGPAPKRKKIRWQITIATLVQPFQYDPQCSAAKDHGIMHAVAAPTNLDAAITVRSLQTELQNTKELRATAPEIAAPKPDRSRRQSKNKSNYGKNVFLRATKGAKNEKINKMRLPQPQLVKTKLSCETPLQKNNSWRCENKAFVRDIPQKVTVEDVKTSFRSRLPAKF